MINGEDTENVLNYFAERILNQRRTIVKKNVIKEAPGGGWTRASHYEIVDGTMSDGNYRRFIRQAPQATPTPYRFDEVVKKAPHTFLLGLFPLDWIDPSELVEMPFIGSQSKWDLMCERLITFAKEFGFLGIPFGPVEAYVFNHFQENGPAGPVVGVKLRGWEEKRPPKPAEKHFKRYNPLLSPPEPMPFTFESLLSTYTEPLEDWMNTIYELRFIMDHVYRAQEGEPGDVYHRQPSGSAAPWVLVKLNPRLRQMPPQITWDPGKGFVPLISSGCLHDFLFFLVYKDIAEGVPVIKCKREKCRQPFFKHSRREFCSDSCANAHNQQQRRKRERERRKNPRPLEEP